ncbi:hypothetical protein [Laspinema olomoucense]|uniref:hypothetical protein n=1 Tax=Laspinema olomoucense TaxID=3231600 RepID=UPI0021BB26AA|nr:hypothetical protein [Laspinema sp. D3d]MCT7974035.1 hypothetical protein [Laspinema sp. D3d]
MAKEKMGEVENPTGSRYPYYWDDVTGEVFVGNERAGKASSREEAWRKANYYATTTKHMK